MILDPYIVLLMYQFGLGSILCNLISFCLFIMISVCWKDKFPKQGVKATHICEYMDKYVEFS